ncbi:MAG: HAD family hydrolase [Proteobacteria bacterium]|nr:HAD family hydrolase [Pseudomonadota bacterium]
MSFELIGLPWLPEAPERFRDLCRELSPSDPGVGAKVQSLATHRLNQAQAAALGKAIARLRGEGAALAPLSGFKLAILANTTFDFIAAALPAAAARHGVALETWLAPLDQVEQFALNPRSALYAQTADGVLLGVDHRWLGLDRAALGGDVETRVEGALARLRGVLEAIVANGRALPIVPTIATPPHALLGSFDRRAPGSTRAMIARVNAALPALCDEFGAALLDVAAWAERVGSAAWFDAANYNLYKLPFAPEAVPLFCDVTARLLGAIRGKARKCLVLDLDNTCWGGVIGDDGLDGICVGGGPEGEAFLAIQQYALDLKARGIILAVCSKNTDEIARGPFREHPNMLLKEADIAVFQANWNDKPSNLEAIAGALDIGIDALVFLDDNGAERAQVRARLPMVAVPEVPADPASFIDHLDAAGYFEAASFTAEDLLRSESYATNAKRAEVLARSSNVQEYLSSLAMTIRLAPFDAVNRARIVQLINKTNQFNLTTRRYTEAEVTAMEQGGAAFTLQTRVADRYGDFGMIGVLIAREIDGETWDIDTFLMSCRVLGRRVEEAMLAEVVAAAKAAGVRTLTARYLPTAKNSMVADHFDNLGFTRLSETTDGAREYSLDVLGFEGEPLPFEFEGGGNPSRPT